MTESFLGNVNTANFSRLDYCFFIHCHFFQSILADFKDRLDEEGLATACNLDHAFLEGYALIKKEIQKKFPNHDSLAVANCQNKLEEAITYCNQVALLLASEGIESRIYFLKSIFVILKTHVGDPFLLSQLIMSDNIHSASDNGDDEKIICHLTDAIAVRMYLITTGYENDYSLSIPQQFNELLKGIIDLCSLTIPGGDEQTLIDSCPKILLEMKKVEQFLDSHVVARLEDDSNFTQFKNSIKLKVFPYVELLRSHFLCVDEGNNQKKKADGEKKNNLSIQPSAQGSIGLQQVALSEEELFIQEQKEFFASIHSSLNAMRVNCRRISLLLASAEGEAAVAMKSHFQQLSWQLMTLQGQGKAYLKQGKITGAQVLVFLFKWTVFSEQLCKLSLAFQGGEDGQGILIRKI